VQVLLSRDFVSVLSPTEIAWIKAENHLIQQKFEAKVRNCPEERHGDILGMDEAPGDQPGPAWL